MGAGSWGTAISWLLGGRGHDVVLWSHEGHVADGVNAEHRNPEYLREVVLPDTVRATGDMAEALSSADAAVMVSPSHVVRSVAERMAPHAKSDLPIVSLAKGVEADTLMRMTQVLEDVLGRPERLAALSGPNHAEEVSKGVPSATVIASTDERTAALFQDAFMAPFFRVYTNTDVVGVELCGASKNVIAVAAGMSDGLGYGDNTKAALMTRGLAEMSRLGRALGANPLTYMGLAGMGDLIATCTSQHSRNRGLGELIAKGGTIAEFTERTHMVAEGATSCITVDDLGTKLGVELPITHQVRAILHGGQPATSAVGALMGREAKDELHGMGLVEDEKEA